MPLHAREFLAALAIVVAASLLGSCATGLTPVNDHYNNLVWKFSLRNFCYLNIGIDDEGHLEKRNSRPPAGAASWESYWLWRLQNLERKGVEDVSLVENAPEYVNYIIKMRRKHGLPDLPGRPSLGVESAMDCTGWGRPPPPDPGPGVVTAPEPRLQETPLEAVAMFPEDAAKRRVSGSAALDCDVDLGGRLQNCVVAEESPLGLGFGAAALRLSAKVQMWPATKDGDPVPGTVRRSYRFPIGMLRLRPAS